MSYHRKGKVLNKGCLNVAENEVTKGFGYNIAKNEATKGFGYNIVFGTKGVMTPGAKMNGEVTLTVGPRDDVLGNVVQDFFFHYLHRSA